ncbi:ClC-a, partial [Symbiodinium sp. CCMP2456]
MSAFSTRPLGGVLLSLELMLPQIYTFQVYWGCFVAAFCGAVSTYLLKTWASGAGYAQLLDSDVSPNEGMVRNYPLGCAVFCLVIGAVFGLLGGAFNLMHDRLARLSSKFCSVRGPVRGFRWRDLAMVMAVAALNSGLTWPLALLHGQQQPALLNALFSKGFHGSASWVNEPLGPFLTLLAATLIKLLLTLLALSCPTPTGVIAPTMVLGALMARALVYLLPKVWLATVLAAPGEDPNAVPEEAIGALAARLAIVGSAAFACGVSRAFGVAITTFEVLSLDSMVLPLSLSSLAAIFTANLIALPFFDLGLVRKGWGCISELTCTSKAEEPAFELMEAYTEFPSLEERISCRGASEALALKPQQFSFPVVRRDAHLQKLHPHHGILLGAVTRQALEEVRRQLEEKQIDEEVDLMQMRWPGDNHLLADPVPLSVDPLATAQELYVMLK